MIFKDKIMFNTPNVKLLIVSAITITLFLVSACRVNYSFSGASIPTEAETVSIKYFPNNAAIVQPTLSQVFTEKLQEKFQNQTRLEPVASMGDLQFTGAIVGYSTAPVGITAQAAAAQQRLTITIKVTFVNQIDGTFDFDKTFSAYEDYDSGLLLTDVEEELIELITDKIVDDIFNQSVVNW